ncbi:MAG: choice-of-anchor Q domain-containing protein [Verrucomicrobiota bacterium]
MKSKLSWTLLGLALVIHQTPLFAGGVVLGPDEGSLRVALRGGGMVALAFNGTIALSNPLVITNDTVIDGTGHAAVLSGNNAVRVFTVANPARLTLLNLSVVNGRVVGGDGSPGLTGGDGFGGAVSLAGGELDATGCQFMGSDAEGGLGGRATNGFGPGGTGGNGLGGAILIESGRMRATNCMFGSNTAGGGAGGQGAGFGGNAAGGAVYGTNSDVLLVNCTFVTNQARGGVIGSYGSGFTSIAGMASGGAVHVQGGTFTNIGSQFIGNSAWATNVPWGGGTFLSGTNCSGGALFCASTGLVSGCSFVSNTASGGNASYKNAYPGHGRGGAVFNSGSIVVSACVFQANQAAGGINGNQGGNGEGGAFYNAQSASVLDSTFNNNLAQGAFAILSSIAYPSGVGKGGALLNVGSLKLSGCTLADNTARGLIAPSSTLSGSAASSAYGGALCNAGVCAITNSTLARNAGIGGDGLLSANFSSATVGADAFGGAIFNAGGTLDCVNSTLALNNAQGGGGAINGTGYGGAVCATNGTASCLNLILLKGISGNNLFGALIDLGHNISSDASCAFAGAGSLNNTDPLLAPLDNYGGPTKTMALLSGSPAIDAADPVSFPAVDQRGRTRPFGTAPDIGAFESSPPYTIHGTISGRSFSTSVLVTAGAAQVATTNGIYGLSGLAGGTWTVTPQDTAFLFVPDNQDVTVGPDRVGVNFAAYKWNVLSVEDYTNGVLHTVFAAPEGSSVRLLSSPDLRDWSLQETVLIGPNRYWEWFIPAGIDPARFYRTANP